MARLVCKQTLRHMAVSIVQIPVTRVVFKHIERRYVAQHYVIHVMLQEFRCQTALVASCARRLIDGSGARKRSLCHGGSELYYITLHWACSHA